MENRKTFLIYIRNLIFGVEDSLVSTVGLLAGIASAGVERSSILFTGIVLIFVGAFSMAAGSFLSQQAIEEYGESGLISHGRSFKSGLIVFFSYFVSGFIPLSPYVLLKVETAFTLSIVLSFASLFILGIISAKVLQTKKIRSGLRMLLIGGIAVTAGVLVGSLVK